MAENAWSALHPVRAALCRAEGNWLWYNRTDPYTGAMAAESHLPSPYAGLPTTGASFIHPMYTQNPLVNDIALVKLEAPFSLSPYTQTVALPATPRQQGMVTISGSDIHLLLSVNCVATQCIRLAAVRVTEVRVRALGERLRCGLPKIATAGAQMSVRPPLQAVSGCGCQALRRTRPRSCSRSADQR